LAFGWGLYGILGKALKVRHCRRWRLRVTRAIHFGFDGGRCMDDEKFLFSHAWPA